MSRLKIEQHWFGNEEYVLINIAVGAMKRPNRLVMRGCQEFKEKSRLCRMLKEKGIKFDIMPVLVDQFDTAAITNEPELSFDDVESLIDDAKSEAMCYTEELRDEIINAGMKLPEGPSLADMGIMSPFEIQMPDQKMSDVSDDIEITFTDGPGAWMHPAGLERGMLDSPFNHSPFDEPKPWVVRVDEDEVKDADALNNVLDSFLKK